MGLLSLIRSPADVKKLSLPELESLAKEIREELVEVVSQTGGHIASNLGVVELTLALHYIYDSPQDRIVWDVGHQSYVHKLLTGRADRFHTLRRRGGLSGFPTRSESEHDPFGAGHGCTSLSASLGIATGRDLLGQRFHVIAVIGDGSMTGGLAFEGLNNIGHSGRNLLVVLNDNKMAISKNVGALAEYLTKISTTPAYTRLETDLWELLGRLPKNMGPRARTLARRMREGVRTLLVPHMPFEEWGFHYEGPVDGHNLGKLIEIFHAIKDMHGPILLHVLTKKGKGFKPAEEDATTFHGVGPFDPDSGEVRTSPGIPSYTEVFGRTLVDLASQDPRIVAVTAAMREGTGLTAFAKTYPERFFDVGMAEQCAVTFSAGLATQKLRPVAAIYSGFLQRAFDQIVHDVALQNLPVIFVLDRAGLVGEDGPTHHGAFDLSYLRHIPNMVVMAPKDENELRHMLRTAIEHEKGPVALRFPRGSGVGVSLEAPMEALPIGIAEVLAEGKDVLIWAIGSMVAPALRCREFLQSRGLQAGVVNARFVKPLDGNLLRFQLSSCKNLVTLEENAALGGFGAGVAEWIQAEGIAGVRHLTIGLPDQFVEHGTRKELLELCGLTPELLTERIVTFLKEDPLRKASSSSTSQKAPLPSPSSVR
jgi:1-deoxy-D-xylulose-5-phosphate synthase